MDMMELRRAVMVGSIKNNIAYEAWNLSFDRFKNEYINTGVYLFNEENINRDFEVVFEGLYSNAGDGQVTILCAKHNGLALGFLIRIYNTNNREFAGTIFAKKDVINDVIIIRRINGILSVEGNTITNQPVPFNPNTVFDFPLYLGCAVTDTGVPYRFATGTIGHIVVRWLN